MLIYEPQHCINNGMVYLRDAGEWWEIQWYECLLTDFRLDSLINLDEISIVGEVNFSQNQFFDNRYNVPANSGGISPSISSIQ
jgi:hypothetical protein